MANQISDAAKNNSTAMNSANYCADKQDGDVKILFLGNSITLHGPKEDIGWSGNWGMAASGPEKDYVHLVTLGIEKATGRKATVRVRNCATFERNYRTWKPDADHEENVAFAPDYLVIALGENAPNLETEQDELAYRQAFYDFLSPFFKGHRFRPRTVVRGVFWPNAKKDYQMAHVASDFGVPFVPTDIQRDPGMTAHGLFWHNGVQAHPGDKGMEVIASLILDAFFPTYSGFQAWAGKTELTVTPTCLSAMQFNQWAPGYQRPINQTETGGMISLESDGAIQLRIQPQREFRRAVLRPLSAGVTPVIAGRDVFFTLPGPGQYVLELDDHQKPLEIFVNPKRDFSKEHAEATICFGPGLHEPKIVKLKSHDRVFIDRYAVVFASFQADNVEDVSITGYGIICGTRSRRDNDHCYRNFQDTPIRLIDSRDIRIDGPVVLDASCWCVEAFNCENLQLSCLKVTGAWRYNTDGIDICNSSHVLIENCYVHSFDDTIVLKGIPEDASHPVEDIICRNCVLWCGWGRTLEIGLETWAPYYRGILFENCDLIHNSSAALSIHLGGPAPVEDVTYRNIRVEYDAFESPLVLQHSRDEVYSAKAPWSGNLLDISNQHFSGLTKLFGPDTDATDPLGTVKSVNIENLSVTVEENAPMPKIRIASASPEVQYGNIRISGLLLNGKHLDDLAAFPSVIENNSLASISVNP